MANENEVLLGTYTVNATGASAVTFSNIPQTGYTDLKLVVSGRSNRASAPTDGLTLTLNSTGVSSARGLYGNGSSAASDTDTVAIGYVTASTATSNTFGNSEIYIPNAFGTTSKSISVDGVGETNATLTYSQIRAALANLTSAITSITLAPTVGTQFLANSTFSLYGISALGTNPLIAPKASGGDIIVNDGTYWYHQFLTTGTFTPSVSLTCDYLVVAGGGSGGSGIGGVGAGGGGAGGFRSITGASLIPQNYTVTIGAGGASVNTLATNGNNGNNSTFSSTTSTGGGGGGTYGNPDGTAGLSGGSGGGGGTSGGGGSPSGGAASPSGQGNAGGAGGPGGTAPYRGGGGGGSSAAGASASTSGNGGAGTASSISGSSVTYAGGGGAGGNPTAGTGGSGGGGAGASSASANATAGTANTGGGGGGACGGAPVGITGAGGSGIVIIRYPIAN